tara:strand:+ start:117 stop:359 length:243 start_codon:yes stop_codon:yes gene_type:complete
MDCAWFIEIRGLHPQTGEEISEWGCSMSMLPVLLIENGRQTSHTGAAIESFRNEMVKANELNTEIMVAAAEGRNPNLIEG